VADCNKLSQMYPIPLHCPFAVWLLSSIERWTPCLHLLVSGWTVTCFGQNSASEMMVWEFWAKSLPCPHCLAKLLSSDEETWTVTCRWEAKRAGNSAVLFSTSMKNFKMTAAKQTKCREALLREGPVQLHGSDTNELVLIAWETILDHQACTKRPVDWHMS
jgi:hypothetical protein